MPITATLSAMLSYCPVFLQIDPKLVDLNRPNARMCQCVFGHLFDHVDHAELVRIIVSFRNYTVVFQ
jgi:hypothetical protein